MTADLQPVAGGSVPVATPEPPTFAVGDAVLFRGHLGTVTKLSGGWYICHFPTARVCCPWFSRWELAPA